MNAQLYKSRTLAKYVAGVALLVAVALGGCASSQLPEAPAELPSSEPFKNTNVMYIETDAEPEAALEKITQALTLQDYEVSESLSEGNTITTMPRSFGTGVAGSARYYVEAMDNGRLKLTGQFIAAKATDRASFEQHTPYTVSAQGGRLSTSRVAWRTMREIAESYRGGTVLYDRGRVTGPASM